MLVDLALALVDLALETNRAPARGTHPPTINHQVLTLTLTVVTVTKSVKASQVNCLSVRRKQPSTLWIPQFRGTNSSMKSYEAKDFVKCSLM